MFQAMDQGKVLKKLGKGFLLAIAGLVCSKFSQAAEGEPSEKTLIRDGLYAAGFGDILIDHGQFWEQNYSALRLRAGFQLLRWKEFSLSIGYSKTGFYDAIYSKEDQIENLQLDYHGPLVEIILLPSYPYSISIGGMVSIHGQSLHNATELPADYTKLDKVQPEDRHKVSADLYVRELHLAVSYEFWNQIQLIAGAGMRQVESKYRFSRCVNDEGVTVSKGPCREVLWPQGTHFATQSDDKPFFFLGIRGSHI